MTHPEDRLFWVREIASDAEVPAPLRDHAIAFLEHYDRAIGLGWTPERAWSRAMAETAHLRRVAG
jgi:hypothetical protein